MSILHFRTTTTASPYIPHCMETSYINMTSSSQQVFLETRIAVGLVTYLWPVIILVGIFGNVLSFCVLIRKDMFNTSVYFYLAMLALADIGVLLLSAFKTWIRTVLGFEFLHVSGMSCKIIMYVFVICLHMSAWFIIAVTIDRFIVIWFPMRALRGSSTSLVCFQGHQCKVISVILIVVLLIYNGHLLWTIDLYVQDGHRSCTSSSDNYFMMSIYPIMKLLSYCVLPFVVVLILNAAIIVRLSNSRRFIGSNSVITNKSTSQHNRITGMLVTLSITWLLLTCPFTIVTIVFKHSHLSYSKAQYFLIKTICFTLMYVNHSINFYLYCLTGAHFRKQLKNVFCDTSRRYTNTKSVFKISRTKDMFLRVPLKKSRT